MTTAPVRRVLARVGRLLADRQLDTLSDRDLLRAFSGGNDEAAFAALVRRHGSMVLGVCRRVLHHEQDAEDACQAAFLILARKAGSRFWQESVAPWLYRVAYRLALRQRRTASRRLRLCEPPWESTTADPLAVVSGRELCLAVDEELQRLPEECRAALVLCCLEGLTRDEAANRLGWSLGTLKRRLERGRALLRHRLSRRGFALPAALAAGLSLAGAADAAVPRLARAIAQAAVRGPGVGKLKLLAGVMLTLCLVGAGMGVALRQPPSPAPAQAVAEPRKPAAGNEKAAPAVDRLGDPLPPGAVARLGTVRLRQGAGVRHLCFSTDGKTLIAVAEPYVRLWDPATGRERRRQQLPHNSTTAISANGTMLLVAPAEPIRFWDLTTLREVRPLGEITYTAAWLATFTPDGKRLATLDGGGKAVTLWDMAQGRQLAQIPLPQIGEERSLAFSPDGGYLALPAPKGVSLWDVKAGREVRRFEVGPAPPVAVAFSPDGTKLAAADPYTPRGGANQVHVWDVRTGEKIAHWKEPADVYVLAFAPDGKTLACGCRYGTIGVRRPDTGELLHRCDAHSFGVTAVAFSADGRRLASGSVEGVIRLWGPATGEEQRPYDSPVNGLEWLAFTPEGKSIVSKGRDQIAVWEPLSGRLLRLLDDQPTHIGGRPTLSPDGKTLAVIGGPKSRVRLWDLARGQDRPIDDGAYRSHRAAFAPDGKTLATLSWKSETPTSYALCLWDAADGRLRRRIALPALPFAVVVWPDGAAVAASVREGPDHCTLRKWRIANGEEVWRTPPGLNVMQAALSPDGRILAGVGTEESAAGLVGFVQLYDAASGRELRRCVGHKETVTSAAFAPDGRTLATSSADGTIRLWEVATGRERRRLQGQSPGEAFSRVCFSPDGRLLASTGADTAGLVWDLTGRFRNGRFPARPLPDREVEQMWAELASADAGQAYRAILALAGSPDNAVPALHQHLRTLTQPVEAKRVAELVADLDSTEFRRRQEAMGELERIGLAAEPALRKVLAGQPALETRRRIEQLLEKLAQTQLLQAGRAVEGLEMIATVEARQALEDTARRARDTHLGREAAAAGQRLARRSRKTGDY